MPLEKADLGSLPFSLPQIFDDASDEEVIREFQQKGVYGMELAEKIARIQELRQKQLTPGMEITDEEIREVIRLLSEVRTARAGKAATDGKVQAPAVPLESYF